jgi:glycosyltransferase involved in cell wall biosynthesis
MVPSDYPIFEFVIIPFHDFLGFSCDYILQTAKELIKKNHLCLIIHIENPYKLNSFFKFFTFKINSVMVNRIAISIIRPIDVIPHVLANFKRLRPIRRDIIFFTSRIVINICNPTIVWCFDTRDSDILPKKTDSRTDIFDCVDNFTSVDKMTNKLIIEEENRLMKMVDFVTVNSKTLYKLKKRPGVKIYEVPLGFDIDSFNRQSTLPKIIGDIPKPKVLYVGNITYRLDFKLLQETINQLPEVSFIFVGEYLQVEPEDTILNTKKKLIELKKLNNAFFVGKFSRREIKSIIQDSSVCIIPYNVKYKFNKYSFPMKLFEYFYMKKPVIATPILELKQFSNIIHISSYCNDWKLAISSLVNKKLSRNREITEKKIAENNSWREKINKVLLCINLEKSTQILKYEGI